MRKELERALVRPAVIAASVAAGATFVAAIVAASATFGSGYLTSYYSEEQIEGNMLIEAVKVCDKQQAAHNVETLLQAGFLQHHAKQLQKALDERLFDKILGDCASRTANAK
jgi:hypothetical protein